MLKHSEMKLAHVHSVMSKNRTANPAAHLSHCQTAFSSFEMKHARDTENFKSFILFSKTQKNNTWLLLVFLLNKKKSLSCHLFSCHLLHFLNTPLFFGTHWTCFCFFVLQGTARVKLTASISCLQKQSIISVISALREGLLEKVVDRLLLWIWLRKQNRMGSTSTLPCKTQWAKSEDTPLTQCTCVYRSYHTGHIHICICHTYIHKDIYITWMLTGLLASSRLGTSVESPSQGMDSGRSWTIWSVALKAEQV